MTREYPPALGGVADYASHLSEALCGIGHTVSVVTSRSADGSLDRGGSLSVHRVIDDWSLRGLRELARTILATSPDVVDFQYVPHMYGRTGVTFLSLLPAIIWVAARVRVVCTLHELYLPWSLGPRRLLVSIAQRLQLLPLLAASQAVIVTNELYRRQVRRWPRRAHVHEVPVGPSIVPTAGALRDSARRTLGLEEGATLIGEIAPFSVGKEPEVLLGVARALGPRTRFALLGGRADDGLARSAFRQASRAAGLSDRFVLSPDLSAQEMSQQLAALDVYVHTNPVGASTRSTGLISAMAHGLPVVAFRGPETSSVFVDGRHLALVDRGHWDNFAARVAALAASPESRTELGNGARELVSERFAWDVVAAAVARALMAASRGDLAG